MTRINTVQVIRPEGGTISYQYPPVKSFPEPAFTWKKDGSVMSESQRISFSKAGNLYIANVDIADVANYVSTVSNSIAAASVDRAQLSVTVTGK